MKEVKYGISSCAECIHLKYKLEEDRNIYRYYCTHSTQFIPNTIDIRYRMPSTCPLENIIYGT